MNRRMLHLAATILVLVATLTQTYGSDRAAFADSSCCAPDSLTFVRATFPVFCVQWHIRSDSNCQRPMSFEIQWKLLTASVWKVKTVVYTSGIWINFCDSVDTCGAYQWRVRAKCNDSTYSEWATGNKFTVICGIRKVTLHQPLTITPNPASSSIAVTAGGAKRGLVKLRVFNFFGRAIAERMVYVRPDGTVSEKFALPPGNRGVYFVTLIVDGVVVNRGSFLKE